MTATVATPPRARHRRSTVDTVGRSGVIVTAASIAVSGVSYIYGVVLAHVLPGKDYAVFAASQTLLLLAGTASAAAIPWALARAVRLHPAGSTGRRDALGYAMLTSALGGLVLGVVLAGVTVIFSRPAAALVVGLAAAAIVVSGCATGCLQGELRFGRLAVGRVAETAIRVGLGLIAVKLGFGVLGAIAGFLGGSLALALIGFSARVGHSRLWADLGWRPATLRDRFRWIETGGLTGVQAFLGILTAVDIVTTPILAGAGNRAGGFQLAGTFGRAPLFIASALSVVLFPRLGGPDGPAAIRSAFRGFGWLALPAAAAVLTVPHSVSVHVVPAHLAIADRVLPAAAIAGLGYAAATLSATVLQGAGRYRAAIAGLAAGIGILFAGLLTGWHVAGIVGLAYGVAAGAVLSGLLLAMLARPLIPAGTGVGLLAPAVTAAAAVPVFLLLRGSPAGWLSGAGGLGLVALWRARSSGKPALADDSSRRLRILHLGFEDPAAPGAGGGSLRTHEINRRLADRHDITVLTTRWPGCRDRVQDGVRYQHVGIGAGSSYIGRIACYAAVLPFVSRKYRADLVVEDFFAPVSTIGAPLWTGRPTVGMVQWLNAREKSRQYKLPFFLVERAGVRTHRHLVAVSDGIAGRLRAMSPRATVDVVGNGVDPIAFAVTPSTGPDIVFVGRLENAQKGVDLLLAAFARIVDTGPGDLIIAGTGPDENALRRQAADLGIADRVRFIGWISGRQKYELLARAGVVAIPSRFETFGIVAVEALACARPVVAFDIDCLREVVPNGCGYRSPEFDVAQFAGHLHDLLADPEHATAMGAAGREFARRFSWDRLAELQERSYFAALEGQ